MTIKSNDKLADNDWVATIMYHIRAFALLEIVEQES